MIGQAELDDVNITDRRLRLGLTQADLAAALGVTPRTVARLEAMARLPRLYDLALTALESSHLTVSPAYQTPQARPRRRLALLRSG